MVLVRLCGAAKPLSSLSSLRPLLSSPLISPPHIAHGTSTTSLSTEPAKPSGPIDRLFGLASNIAGPGTNRWTMFVPAFCTHVCLGSPYGWSAISAQLTREAGVVTSAAGDWSLDLATYPMSMIIASGGIAAAILGSVAGKIGIRKSMAMGALLYGAGWGLSATGVATHNLPLLYAGNFVCGAGYGLTYTPPIQALIDWFPDRKGLASGLVIAGFGSGALFFTPMMSMLTSKFSVLPTYLGSSLEVVLEGGKQFANIGGQLQEVVYATTSELAKLPYENLAEGFYLVGSGNTGVASALGCMGAIYAGTILSSSLMIRRPAPGFIPAGYVPPEGAAVTTGNVDVATVMKTPQFWFLFSTSTLLCTGGMGLISVAKPMIQNVFADAMPLLVTSAFASAYLMAMAAGNLGGRIGWAAISDKIGRRNTFHCYTLGSIPIFGCLPFLINECVTNPSGPLAPVYLSAFCVSSVAAITILGGTFAVLPAYEADLYGPKYVGAIHGRFLLAASLSTVLGPGLLLNLRQAAETKALTDLLSRVDPSAFVSKFGTDISSAQSLIEAKTLTISKLMTIMPQGTVDPSPFLYNNTMYTMSALVGVAAALHFMVKPVDKKYFEKVEEK